MSKVVLVTGASTGIGECCAALRAQQVHPGYGGLRTIPTTSMIVDTRTILSG